MASKKKGQKNAVTLSLDEFQSMNWAHEMELHLSDTKASKLLFDTASLPSFPKDDLQGEMDLSGMQGPPYQLFVGSLSLDANDDDLRALFEQHCKVEEAKVIITEGRKRGIAFVTVPTREDARSAIQKLNNFNYKNNVLSVKPSEPKGGDRGGAPDRFGGGGRDRPGSYGRTPLTGPSEADEAGDWRTKLSAGGAGGGFAPSSDVGGRDSGRRGYNDSSQMSSNRPGGYASRQTSYAGMQSAGGGGFSRDNFGASGFEPRSTDTGGYGSSRAPYSREQSHTGGPPPTPPQNVAGEVTTKYYGNHQPPSQGNERQSQFDSALSGDRGGYGRQSSRNYRGDSDRGGAGRYGGGGSRFDRQTSNAGGQDDYGGGGNRYGGNRYNNAESDVVAAPAAPTERPKLVLQKPAQRKESLGASDAGDNNATAAKADVVPVNASAVATDGGTGGFSRSTSIFGQAKPVDTLTKQLEIEKKMAEKLKVSEEAPAKPNPTAEIEELQAQKPVEPTTSYGNRQSMGTATSDDYSRPAADQESQQPQQHHHGAQRQYGSRNDEQQYAGARGGGNNGNSYHPSDNNNNNGRRQYSRANSGALAQSGADYQENYRENYGNSYNENAGSGQFNRQSYQNETRPSATRNYEAGNYQSRIQPQNTQTQQRASYKTSDASSGALEPEYVADSQSGRDANIDKSQVRQQLSVEVRRHRNDSSPGSGVGSVPHEQQSRQEPVDEGEAEAGGQNEEDDEGFQVASNKTRFRKVPHTPAASVAAVQQRRPVGSDSAQRHNNSRAGGESGGRSQPGSQYGGRGGEGGRGASRGGGGYAGGPPRQNRNDRDFQGERNRGGDDRRSNDYAGSGGSGNRNFQTRTFHNLQYSSVGGGSAGVPPRPNTRRPQDLNVPGSDDRNRGADNADAGGSTPSSTIGRQTLHRNSAASTASQPSQKPAAKPPVGQPALAASSTWAKPKTPTDANAATKSGGSSAGTAGQAASSVVSAAADSDKSSGPSSDSRTASSATPAVGPATATKGSTGTDVASGTAAVPQPTLNVWAARSVQASPAAAPLAAIAPSTPGPAVSGNSIAASPAAAYMPQHASAAPAPNAPDFSHLTGRPPVAPSSAPSHLQQHNASQGFIQGTSGSSGNVTHDSTSTGNYADSSSRSLANSDDLHSMSNDNTSRPAPSAPAASSSSSKPNTTPAVTPATSVVNAGVQSSQPAAAPPAKSWSMIASKPAASKAVPAAPAASGGGLANKPSMPVYNAADAHKRLQNDPQRVTTSSGSSAVSGDDNSGRYGGSGNGQQYARTDSGYAARRPPPSQPSAARQMETDVSSR